MYFQLYVPAWIWGLFLVAMLVLVANAGMRIADTWFAKQTLKHNNEIAGIVFGVLSLIYSLIIAFVFVAVWENYEELNRTIEKESDHLNSVLVHSNALGDSLRSEVADAIRIYCEKVVREEWDMDDQHAFDQGSAIPDLRLLLFRVEEQSSMRQNVLSIIDSDLSNITSLHRERLAHTHAYVPELVWMILIIGSVMVICFSFFLNMESIQLKRIYLSFLWAIIGMSLFLIFMLDHPFLGSTQVSKTPYEKILKLPTEENRHAP